MRTAETRAKPVGAILLIAMALPLFANGQEQRPRPPTDIYIDGQSDPQAIADHLQTGPRRGVSERVGERETAEPGPLNEDLPNRTTIYAGERGRQSVIGIENPPGQTGLLIGGEEPSEAERMRSIASQNLERGSVIDGPPEHREVDITIFVDSIIIQTGRPSVGPRPNVACVRIGVVGDQGVCDD